MKGRPAWNKGKKLEGEELERQRERTRNRNIDPIKQAEGQKKRLEKLKDYKHSEETKNKLSEITAKRYSDGTFKRETSIHIKVREFLNEIPLKCLFEEEYHLVYFSLDFAFPEFKIAIECQGTYFHIDPRFYPNGPSGKIQKRNFGRDKSKKKFLDKKGWTMIELWETEINNEEFKNILTCKLQELYLLNH
jgi:very-short-patch-repair endonuclease